MQAGGRQRHVLQPHLNNYASSWQLPLPRSTIKPCGMPKTRVDEQSSPCKGHANPNHHYPQRTSPVLHATAAWHSNLLDTLCAMRKCCLDLCSAVCGQAVSQVICNPLSGTTNRENNKTFVQEIQNETDQHWTPPSSLT